MEFCCRDVLMVKFNTDVEMTFLFDAQKLWYWRFLQLWRYLQYNSSCSKVKIMMQWCTYLQNDSNVLILLCPVDVQWSCGYGWHKCSKNCDIIGWL